MRLRQFLMIAAVAATVTACAGGGAATTAPSAAAPSAAAPSEAARRRRARATLIKLGLITKFPVDFFFTIENAAKDWAAQHPDVELITGQGKAGDDHEGQIAIIESMVAQASRASP